MAQRKAQPKVETVEPVTIVDKRSGTICTVGSNVVEKYIGGSRPRYREYDPELDERDDDVYEDDDPDVDVAEESDPPAAATKTPAKK